METLVRDVMLTELTVVQEDTLLREATRNILIRGLKYVAVVDENRASDRLDYENESSRYRL